MKNIVYIIIILFILPSLTSAGEIYTYTDKDGNTVISNEPPPEEVKSKAKKIESYERDSPAAIAAFQMKQRAAEARGFREWQASLKQSSGTPYSPGQSAQESRDKRAAKVISDTKARLQAVKDSGFSLPNKNINIIEKAAEEKARQIKAGTDTPMTQQEDADFHARQKERQKEYEHEFEMRRQQSDYEAKMRQQQYEIDKLKRGW